jgi:hypothetical protein
MRRQILLLASLFSLIWASSSYAAPSRPLVFIPGILGSNLAHGDEIIWGDGGSLSDFAKLSLLPNEGSPLPLKSQGIVESTPLFFGLIQLEQYGPLIEYLEKQLGYKRNETLFLFDYDWRYSNFSTASEFSEFVESQPELRVGSFDILVHSMGGLVARIFLVNGLPGSERTENLIEMAVPHKGSVDAIGTLTEGWGLLRNYLAGGQKTIRATVLSFSSIYELFPHYENCCAFGPQRPISENQILDPEFWLTHFAWLIDTGLRDEERRGLLRGGLKRAQDIREIMGMKVPSHVKRYYTFVGYDVNTRETVYFDSDQRSIRFRPTRNGDGTVHRQSAGSLEAFPIPAVGYEHATLFNDATILISLREALVGAEKINPVHGLVIAGRELINRELVVLPEAVPVGEVVFVSLALCTAEKGGWDIERFSSVRATIERPSGGQFEIELSATRAADPANGLVVFAGQGFALQEEGSYTVRASVNDQDLRVVACPSSE